MDDERCRITVVGRLRRVDLAVPAQAPIAEYVSVLSRMCGQDTDETFPAAWSLAPAGARPFPPDMSLLEAQVVDGATLYLRDVLEGEADAPVVTDIEEIVEELADRWSRWNSRHWAMTIVGVGVAGLLAALAVPILRGSDDPPAGLLAILAGFGLALLARLATRRDWPVPVPLRIAVALAACPAFALAGGALPVDGGGARAVAVAAGAVVGAITALVALPHEGTLIVTVLAAAALPLAIVLVAAGADLVQGASVVGVAALLTSSSASAVSGRLVMLVPAPSVPGTAPDPVAEIADSMGRSRGVLIVLAVVTSLVSAACLVVLAGADDPFAVALALCLSLALPAQAGQSVVPVAVMAGVTAGAAGLVALAIEAPARLPGVPGVVPLLVTCGLLAVLVVGGFALATRPLRRLNERPSWLATTGLMLSVLSVPLAVGAFGVFQHLIDVGGRL
ncbi:EsaB/YukD family protein [Actinoallomurus acaciae]|uniref:EsaB/YukD family protein n=1 Tax=Actinoallomurus acaciae TaxID=502577 RepID=A0ABV5Y9L9_9ACTN